MTVTSAAPQLTILPRAKRLPAYGKRLLGIRQCGIVPPGPYVVVCLDSWDWGKKFDRCVVTPDLDPAQTDFKFVAGLDVVLIFDRHITSPDRVDATIRELLQCLPISLRTLSASSTVTRDAAGVFEDVHELRWIKSRAAGIELEQYK